ncbi:Bro-N domain-containing protein [Staphylococcus epidermidis]|uniref:BRO-N domain-containing protein n=1 Tax=Staphylococcus TaxID=1279 RepID=UPI0008A8B65F|nr:MULTISPECIES: Bro-N domain-containing protein [Staphylococcus]MBM6118476.1 Bro-N domain-containing protein [Staphylococcus epidermidis]MCG1145929.1 Bro-N domain-containing protein [Staphylococcus epidermidis]MCO6226354.1 Bro-N domain-containing protein [Staphylococcus epidermidis]MCO6230645.1 Bro-N domain-containing protein [Staphylococcus epidermidis]OHO25772.1 antirepressor [Staphylococcus sp. HMSC034A07]
MIKQIFNDKEIRFIEKNDEYWSVAGDVAKVLGFRDANTAVRYLPTHTRGTLKGRTTSDKKKARKFQDYTVINEKGIYRLVMRSNKTEAEEFQDWICDVLVELRQSTGLKRYEAFRMLDKEKQKEAMDNLKNGIEVISKKDYCKAQAISNKAVSNVFGFPKMIKKQDMTQEMLKLRQQVLNDTVEFMVFVDKYNLPLSVKKHIYDKYNDKQKMA